MQGQREAASFAFAAAAAVKKAGGHPEAGNSYQCHPQLLPASSFKGPAAPLYPRQPLSCPKFWQAAVRPLRAHVTSPLRGCQLPIVLRASPAFLWIMKGNA